MVDVDMLAWHGLGSSFLAADYWSIGNSTPKLDDVQSLDLVSHEFNADNSRVKIVTKRRLDTGETSEDYLIPLNQEIDMVWAWK